MTDCKKKSKLQTQIKIEDQSFNSTSLRCFKCNERGHKKADCLTSTNELIMKEEPNKVRISCTYCKFTGHKVEIKSEVAVAEYFNEWTY